MKGTFANIYIRTAVINRGYTSQSSCLVTPVRVDQTITRTMFWGEEKEFFVYTGDFVKLIILFSSLKQFCPEAVFCVKDMLVHWVENEDLLDIMIFQSLPLTFTLAYWVRTALKATK